MNVLASRGLEHSDIAARNIVFDPASKRVSMIDMASVNKVDASREVIKQRMQQQWEVATGEGTAFGVTPIRGVVGGETEVAFDKTVYQPKVEIPNPLSPDKTVMRKRKILQSAEMLRESQVMMWNNDREGGQRHLYRKRNSGIMQPPNLTRRRNR